MNWDQLSGDSPSEEEMMPNTRKVTPIRQHPSNQKKNENYTAFDGSPLPEQELPEVSPATVDLLEQAMTPLEDEEIPMVCSIYGNIGTGKTISGMRILQKITDPQKDILYVGTAKGWASLRNHPELRKRVQRMKYENQEQLVALGRAIEQDKGRFANIGAVMFDEYTMMHDNDLYWVTKSRSKQNKDAGKFKDPHTPALPDYNSARIRSNEVINVFVGMDKFVHLMFICHERVTKTHETVPDFPDKAGKEFYRILHGVYFAKADKAAGGYSRTLQLVGANRITAKNRIGGLGATATPEEIAEAYMRWGIEDSDKEDKVSETADSLGETDELDKLLASVKEDN